MKRFHGIIVAMLTAATENGELCERGLRQTAEHAIQNGCAGLLALGTTGEPTAWTAEERGRILDIVLDQAAGRVPVLVGCGAASTRETIANCRAAQERSVDALAVVTPFFITPDQEDLYQHYRLIAEASDKPIYLYNIPQRTGVCLAPETVARIKALPNVAGIKDSSGDLELFKRFLALQDEGFQVIQGIDALYCDSFLIGCTAGISGPANFILKNQKRIYDACVNGDLETARRYQQKFLRFKALIPLAPGPTVPKEAANIIGLQVGPPMLPLHRPGQPLHDKIESVLREEFMDCFITEGETT